MKITPVAITTVSIIAICMGANANPLFDIYAGATIGAGGVTTYYDGHSRNESAQSFGGILGIDIPLLRFEGEYNYLRDKDLELNMGAFNVYAKIPSLVVSPYIGAGIGGTFDKKMDTAHDIKFEKNSLYQGMLGITFDIPTLPIKVDTEARAIYMPNAYKIADEKTDVLHYDLRLKIRYIF